MKTLLDEQLDRRLKEKLSKFEVYLVEDFNWQGLKNGKLREKLNENQFQILITADKNLPFQQDLRQMNFSIILLDTPSLAWRHQLPFVPKVEGFLRKPPIQFPKIIFIGIPGFVSIKKKTGLLNLAGKENILFL